MRMCKLNLIPLRWFKARNTVHCPWEKYLPCAEQGVESNRPTVRAYCMNHYLSAQLIDLCELHDSRSIGHGEQINTPANNQAAGKYVAYYSANEIVFIQLDQCNSLRGSCP